MGNNKRRLFYLDFLRVFAILSVVLLHCIDSLIVTLPFFGTTSWKISIVLNEITRTGVPLFLMISGYLMLSDKKSEELSYFYKKRLPRLLIPLVLWCIIYYVFNAYRGDPASVRGFFDMLINNGTSYHMWFVYTLISFYLVTPFLKKLVDSITAKQLLLLILIIVFPTTIRPFINTVTPIYIYLFEPIAQGYLGYFLLGYLLGKTELTKPIRAAVIAGGCVGCVIGIAGNCLLSSPEALNLFFNGGYTVNHYLFASGLFMLAKTVTENIDIPAKLSRAAAKLSDISFGVYWIHVLILTLLEDHLILDLSPIGVAAVQFIIVSTVSCAVMFGLSFVKPLKKLLM